MELKKLVKNSPLLAQAFYMARRLRYSLTILRYRRNETEKNSILFNSFNGRGYGDNPKAIAEAFHKFYPQMKLVWAVSDEIEGQTLPAYIHPVKFQSGEYFKALTVSKVWIFNVLPPYGIRKRKGQIYVQTWHGDRPLKKILKDAAEDSLKYKNTSEKKDSENKLCDYFVSSSEWFSDVWRRTADYEGEILEYGMPRNDCLINWKMEENLKRVRDFKEKYMIPLHVKILLYAPTFRDHSLNNEVENQPDLRGILKYLEAKDQCTWICMVRGHSGSHLKISGTPMPLIDVTSYPDMSDVLMASDLLITDYSSCAGDFAVLHRPVILYQPDRNEYTERDRTLYFRMSDTPYFIACSMQEIYNLLDSLDEEMVYQNCEDILLFYKVRESGTSSETVCRIIAEKMAEDNEGYESGRY